MAIHNRILDIHLTSSSGWYDFANEIATQGDYKVEKTPERLGGGFVNLCLPAHSIGAGVVKSRSFQPKELPESGMVACALNLDLVVEKPVENKYYRPLVEWVSETSHTGKIRFNCHGAQGGQLIMYGNAEKSVTKTAYAAYLVPFLVANGMEKLNLESGREFYRDNEINHGISTIALNCCYGACSLRFGDEKMLPAGINMVASALTKAGFRGVRVTGSTKTMATAPRSKQETLQKFDKLWQSYKQEWGGKSREHLTVEKMRNGVISCLMQDPIAKNECLLLAENALNEEALKGVMKKILTRVDRSPLWDLAVRKQLNGETEYGFAKGGMVASFDESNEQAKFSKLKDVKMVVIS